jgi:hypothetical protein
MLLASVGRYAGISKLSRRRLKRGLSRGRISNWWLNAEREGFSESVETGNCRNIVQECSISSNYKATDLSLYNIRAQRYHRSPWSAVFMLFPSVTPEVRRHGVGDNCITLMIVQRDTAVTKTVGLPTTHYTLHTTQARGHNGFAYVIA